MCAATQDALRLESSSKQWLAGKLGDISDMYLTQDGQSLFLLSQVCDLHLYCRHAPSWHMHVRAATCGQHTPTVHRWQAGCMHQASSRDVLGWL